MQRVCGRFIFSFRSHNFVNCFQLYSTASSSDAFANYLVDSLGFSHQQALSTSTKLSKSRKVNDFDFDSNANSVVGFFKNHGFDDAHIRKIVSFNPRFLCSDVENTLRPKLQVLQDQGFSGSDIIGTIAVNPRLLVSGVESSILPAVQILRQVMVCDAHVIAVFRKVFYSHFHGIVKNLLPNVALLRSYGIPIELIRKHFLMHTDLLLQNPGRLKDNIIRAENLGISRDSGVFLYGVRLLSNLTEETIESKRRMFRSFGWTDFEVHTFVMKNAGSFSFSNASLKKKLDFFMNDLQLEPAYLTSRSAFFNCSLEKRIVPRHKVLQILKEKGLRKRDPSLYSAICMSESRFLKTFVLPFKEAHEVYAKHTGCGMKMLTQESANILS